VSGIQKFAQARWAARVEGLPPASVPKGEKGRDDWRELHFVSSHSLFRLWRLPSKKIAPWAVFCTSSRGVL
jgi:hypothetical protein